MSNPYPPGPPYDGQNTPYNHPGGYSPPPGGDPGYGPPQGAPGMGQQPYPQQYPQQPYGGQYQQPYPQQPGGPANSDDRTMALLAHLGGLFLGFLVPLVLYLVKKDESPFVRHHAAQALNFQILVFIGYFVSGLLMMVFIGFLTFVAVWIASIIMGIKAAMAANNGESYSYPVSIPAVN
ncbi:DUF4870 domain-containing protein [Nocardiopsis gilva YIM 90087]|uniref:DUF4870 domain-containing protein n=1 Tax=Nocardiopsis gilva YIM 90087 TaxID=1235441 RepID=A0A223SEA1_9ACTN|nr:DUF4870 domain-containing protein [Nocardiopsis gilva]ASU86339.1 DUF4870 domain-containing protein [Nocardiopsis gilva YIM 90087]